MLSDTFRPRFLGQVRLKGMGQTDDLAQKLCNILEPGTVWPAAVGMGQMDSFWKAIDASGVPDAEAIRRARAACPDRFSQTDPVRNEYQKKTQLALPAPPPPGQITFVDPTGRSSFQSPPADLTAPKIGCVFVGYRTSAGNQELDTNLARAQQHGYTDIHETDLPPCPAPASNTSGWEQIGQIALRPWCFGGGNMIEKAVWACPGPDYERLKEEAIAKATYGCEKLFISQGYFDSQDKQAKIQAEIASGRRIVEVATGKVLNPGSRSQAIEKEVWSCPGFVERPPTGPASKYPTKTPPELPMAPVGAKPDLVPVAAGAGVVALLAAIAGGVFGK